MTHPCEIPTCHNPVADGKLMCLPHWRKVPPSLQRDVYNTWRAFNGTSNASSRLSRIRAYRAARDAAIKAVMEVS